MKDVQAIHDLNYWQDLHDFYVEQELKELYNIDDLHDFKRLMTCRICIS